MREKLVILGGGESGTGAAILGEQRGWEVFLSDRNALKPQYRNLLLEQGIRFEENGHSEGVLLKADQVVKSPGIPGESPLIKRLLARGIPLCSELEFASRYTKSLIIGITGTNGKTTTATLTHRILKRGGLDVGLGGNTGRSFSKLVALEPHAVYVLEISSFQLDDIYDFKPHIAVITNITPDHLDRYGGRFGKYAASKFKLLKNQDAQCAFLYDADDPTITKYLNQHELPAETYPFSTAHSLEKGAWLTGEEIHFKTRESNFSMKTPALALLGKHNVRNSMASGLAASLMQIRKQTIRESLADFTAIPHRLEPVLRIHQMQFINDSKATNVNATFYALESMDLPTVWIAGGVDKGNDYTDLLPLVEKKVKALIALGRDNTQIIDFFQGRIPVIREAKSMAEAVKIAYALGEKGDNVLLSPACASFDLFESYEDRGAQFKREVKKL